MADVAPELLQRIQEAFNGYVEGNGIITRIRGKPRATQTDVHKYAEELGKMLSKAYMDVLTEDALPNGTLYRNIAERIIPPMLKEVHGSVVDFAVAVQSVIDKADGLGIGAVAPDFPELRVMGLVEKASNPLAEYAEQIRWLGEPVINNAEAFVDDFVRENARTRAQMGFKTSITRTVAPKCCEWCDRIGGVYEYGREPKDVYLRHEYCRCIVTFKNDRTLQNVWSKRIWKDSEDDTQLAIDMRARDQAVDAYAQLTGKTRTSARDTLVNLSTDAINKEITKLRKKVGTR